MELYERVKNIFKVSKKNSDVNNTVVISLFLNAKQISPTVFLYLIGEKKTEFNFSRVKLLVGEKN